MAEQCLQGTVSESFIARFFYICLFCSLKAFKPVHGAAICTCPALQSNTMIQMLNHNHYSIATVGLSHCTVAKETRNSGNSEGQEVPNMFPTHQPLAAHCTLAASPLHQINSLETNLVALPATKCCDDGAMIHYSLAIQSGSYYESISWAHSE